MLIVDLELQNEYEEFLGKTIQNGKLKNFTIVKMRERIKFRIDEAGARV